MQLRGATRGCGGGRHIRGDASGRVEAAHASKFCALQTRRRRIQSRNTRGLSEQVKKSIRFCRPAGE
jgi:hypothetical protein